MMTINNVTELSTEELEQVSGGAKKVEFDVA